MTDLTIRVIDQMRKQSGWEPLSLAADHARSGYRVENAYRHRRMARVF
jgi:hypothetical protein